MESSLKVIGIDPGGTTGWCRVIVPRLSIFGRDNSAIESWDFGEFAGPEEEQTLELVRLVRATQALAYKTGPALVVEDWTIDPHFRSADPTTLSPVRIGAMLRYSQFRGECGDAQIIFQNRQLHKSHMTDERLRKIGMYVRGSDHIRDATRIALTALARAKQKPELRNSMWKFPPLSDPSKR